MGKRYDNDGEGIRKKATSPNGWIPWGLCICFLLAACYEFLNGVFLHIDDETNSMMFFVAMAFGFIWPAKSVREAWKNHRLCCLPLEILLVICFALLIGGSYILHDIHYCLYNVSFQNNLKMSWSLGNYEAKLVILMVEMTAFILYFFASWFLGVCAKALPALGFVGYLKEKCLVVRFCRMIKNKIKALLTKFESYDLTRNGNKLIWSIVIVNAFILFIISSLWFGGYAFILIYSALLYFILRKYVSTIQKRYTILLKGVNDIAEGNLNVTITEDLGVFEAMKPQISRIQNGLKKAVENEVKSQRMKSELITNVSHDLKTPLTAIITYINLLKDENITEEQRKEYLDTLERKSLRLKVLIEDLFEVSKATSNNVTMNYMDVDILNLVKQVSFEMSDKLDAVNLDVRLNLPEGKISLRLDSQKTYRVYENLFGNVAKYAMPGTRVYVSGVLKENCIEIVIRNIAAQEITVDSEELTERFVRNDTSRNTDGSGLGLAIAKSFVELQGGELLIHVDGDLFKVTTRWPLSVPETGADEKAE